MTSVLDIAYYIVNKLGDMTTMKMQKLVYYAQAWSLVWDEEPLFENDFEAWANGPVCVELFQKFKGKYRVSKSDFEPQDIEGVGNLKKYQIETLNSIIKFYGDKTSHWLSELTHQESPWINARGGLSEGEVSTEVITKESMEEYYGKISEEA